MLLLLSFSVFSLPLKFDQTPFLHVSSFYIIKKIISTKDKNHFIDKIKYGGLYSIYTTNKWARRHMSDCWKLQPLTLIRTSPHSTNSHDNVCVCVLKTPSTNNITHQLNHVRVQENRDSLNICLVYNVLFWKCNS